MLELFCIILIMNNSIKIISNNKKAHFNYFLSDAIECGVVLTGTEIKSLRTNGCTINDAYVVFKNSEAFVLNMHISEYKQGNIFNHEPLRTRKLLLHKKEILKLSQKVKLESYTVIPVKVYLKNGLAKIEIALAKGKKLYDKREDKKKQDTIKEMDRYKKEKNNAR